MVPRIDGVAVPIPQAVLDRGADKGRRWLDQIRQCVESGKWPGIDGDPNWTLQTPTREMDDDEPEILVDDE